MGSFQEAASQVLCLYLEIINVVTFVLYGLDKQYARRHKWRIPEKVLLGLAALGGSAGAYGGMLLFRHKTRKNKFRFLVPLFLMLHIGILIYFKIL